MKHMTMLEVVIAVLFFTKAIGDATLNDASEAVSDSEAEGAMEMEKFVEETTKEAISQFNEKETLYEKEELNKGYYKKWTPGGIKTSKDARLLEAALSQLEEQASGIEGNDYALDLEDTDLQHQKVNDLKKTDRIRMILKQLQSISNVTKQEETIPIVGSDYMDDYYPYAYPYSDEEGYPGYSGEGSYEYEEEEEVVDTTNSCDRTQVDHCETGSRYRTEDGSCNNLQFSSRGRANTRFTRLLEVIYEDGVGEPRITQTLPNSERMVLPNPRLVAKRVHQNREKEVIPSTKVSHLLMQFGQFLDHDITLTPEPELECCSEKLKKDERCFNIYMDDTSFVDMSTDPIHTQSYPAKKQTCISFSRSDPACNSGEDFRQQLNSATSFVDGSNLYSSDPVLARALRWTKKDWSHLGFLQVNHGNFKDLPTMEQLGITADKDVDRKLKVAGDPRCNEHPGLVSMHTLWLNEHNRIAYNLRKQDTIKGYIEGKTVKEKDEFIFQEARRLVVAEMQHIVYTEFLPLVLGPQLMKQYELNTNQGTEYDPSVDASILNEFATVSFRFGHTLIGSTFGNTNQRKPLKDDSMKKYKLQDAFFNEHMTHCINETCMNDNSVGCTNTTCMLWSEDILYGLVNLPAESDDIFLNDQLINFLFLSKEIDIFNKQEKHTAESSDLGSRNIQRGRDHGLPGYNYFRTHVENSALRDLNEFGLDPCLKCMKTTKSGDKFCNPYFLPDRQCEHCLNYGSYSEMFRDLQEKRSQKKQMPCEFCIERKCTSACLPKNGEGVKDVETCAKCFQNQIIALHSCQPPYRTSDFVDQKCACKECINERSRKAEKLEEKEVGIKLEDFVRLGEVYCWHMDSIDAFTGSIAEISLEGALQGPTNAGIIANQFKKLMVGDRFFYSHKDTSSNTFSRGLDDKSRKAVNSQSMASVICNNLQTYRTKSRKKKNMKMKINPFQVDSPWKSCSDILKDAHVNFPALANKIVKADNQRLCKDNSNNADCQNIESECEENGECIKKYEGGNFECIDGECVLAVTHCLDADDCQHLQDNECSDGVCSQKADASCGSIGCNKRWHTCKQYSVTTTKYCVCKFSSDKHVFPNCPKTP